MNITKSGWSISLRWFEPNTATTTSTCHHLLR